MTTGANGLPVSPALFVALFAIAFPLFWIAISGLIASMGWRGLAASYAATSDPPLSARRIRFASLRIGDSLRAANYGSCIDGWVTQSGLWLRPFLFFRPFHPMLFLPWARIEAVSEEKRFMSSYVRVRLAGDVPDLLLRGALGRAVFDRK